MKLRIIDFHKTPLYLSVSKGKFEIVEFLLNIPKINVNLGYILDQIFFYKILLKLLMKFMILFLDIICNYLF